MDISSLWSMQFMMFFLCAAGAVLRKTNILKDNSKSVITDLVLYFILPCNIIKSFQTSFEAEILTKFAIILAISIGVQVVSYTLSRILYNKKPNEIKRVLQYCTIVSNSGFLGLPIAQSVFGAEGLMYASVFIIPMRIMMWSAGVACFTEAPDMKTVVKKLLVHPCIVALYIGVPLLIFQNPLNALYTGLQNGLPTVLSGILVMLVTAIGKMINSAGGCTTSLTMILIGTMLTEIRPADFLDTNCLLITVMRQAVLPGLTLLACLLLGIDPLLTGVAVLITGMPAGSTSAILAAKYGCDYSFATKCVVVSTLISLLTIPLWCMIL